MQALFAFNFYVYELKLLEDSGQKINMNKLLKFFAAHRYLSMAISVFALGAIVFFVSSPKVFAVPELGCENRTALQSSKQGNRVTVFCNNSDVTLPNTLDEDEVIYDANIACSAGTIANDRIERGGFNAYEFFCRPSGNISISGAPTLLRGTPAPPGRTSGDCVNVDIGVDPCGEDGIMIYLTAIIKFLTAGVGMVVIIMIVVGGIQYTTSGGDPNGVAAAKGRIVNAIIALLLFIFAAAILNFLIPGGLL